MIELNIPYSGKVLAEELFQITPKTFSNNRKKYLEYLSQFYIFEQVGKKIILKKQLKPFIPKNKNRKKSEENMSVYKDLTHKIIAQKPLNTGSNIAREIFYSPLRPFEHATGTIENYVRPVLKQDFAVESKTWSKVDYVVNSYEPLTFEESSYLMMLFRETAGVEKQMEITADYKCGNISKEEWEKAVSSIVEKKYDRIMTVFKERFGFKPYKVPKWREKSLEEKKKDLLLIQMKGN